MAANENAKGGLFTGLSARLLVLTIFFVMLSEVFIYAPSIGRFRLNYMQERIAAAHLATLALEVPTDNKVSERLLQEILDHARSHGIVLKRPATKALMLTRRPPVVVASYDLRQVRFFPLIWEAFRTLARDGSRLIKVIDHSPRSARILVETVIDEAPMRAAMYDYSARIVLLSIIISLVTATLVFLTLQWVFVRPMLGITQNMVHFHADPEDAGRVIRPSGRRDEIGRAQRELADMQTGLRAALQQRARLAALGTAVTKINHDLRNILATAQLVSDTVGSSDDPKVKRVAPTLLGAIDRAVKLCGQTLAYAHEGAPAPQFSRFDLGRLVDEVSGEIAEAQNAGTLFENRLQDPIEIEADRDQIARVLSNLILNAYQSEADRVSVSAISSGGMAHVKIADTGPGLPAKIRERLFQPFSGSGKAGGGGLGLAIARELARGHGGDIVLAESGEAGTVFEIRLPLGRDTGAGHHA